jgi:hypothetical protein
MALIRIPEEHWEKVWFALLEAGPVSRVGKDFEYVVSDRQLRLLRRKKLPYELVNEPNGRRSDNGHA